MHRNRSHLSVDAQAVHVQFNAPPVATSSDLAELVSLVRYPVLSKRIGLKRFYSYAPYYKDAYD